MRLRTFVFLIVLVTATVSLYAQIPVTEQRDFLFKLSRDLAGNGPEEFQGETIQAVRATLNLSDVQVNALKALLKMRQDTTEQMMHAAHETQQALDNLTSQKNPNPNEVGMAFLASRSAHEQIQAAEEKFRTDFKALLNAGQRATLDKLKAESEQIHSLAELGLLDEGFHATFEMPLHSGVVGDAGFAIGIERHLSKER
jgi:Spy/CpxP family protein refolding chaperone